jgi:hypothetical protein
MKKYVSILLVLLVVTALSVSGCTMLGGNNGGKTATPTATPGTTEPTSTVEPTAAATATPSLADTLGSLYQKSKFSWYEYQYTMDMGEGQSIVMKMKMEFLGTGVDPKDGVSGEHMRSTTTMTMPGMSPTTTVSDFYSKPDSGSSDSKSSDYSSSTAQLVNAGIETITVPAGTFTCTKYTVTDSGMEGTSTFWSSPQAPVPVKFSVTSEGTTMDMVLVGWG